MTDMLMLIILFTSSFAGFISLSLAMNKYLKNTKQPEWFKKDYFSPFYSRFFGGVLLLISLLASITIWGFAIGLPAWCGLIALIAVLQVFVLTYCIEMIFNIYIITLIFMMISSTLYFLSYF